MNVVVLYFAELQKVIGKDQEKIEIPQPHLNSLIRILIKKYGKKIEGIIRDKDTQKINSLISIIINNQAIHEKDPNLIRLNDGDTVVFLMPVSGG